MPITENATPDPQEESSHAATRRFPNWPNISVVIDREHGSDARDLVESMLGTYAPDLAHESTIQELQDWFGFEDWLILALTNSDHDTEEVRVRAATDIVAKESQQ